MLYRVVAGFLGRDGSWTAEPVTGATLDAPNIADACRIADVNLPDDVMRSCVDGRALKLWCLETNEASIYSAENGWWPMSA